MSRLYIPQGITPAELTRQLDEHGELNSELGRNAITALQHQLDERSQRQQAGRYAPGDVAAMLAAQTGDDDVNYWAERIREAWRDGLLMFWMQSGKLHICRELSDDCPLPMEYYLGLNDEYTTSEAINDWLEKAGDKLRFSDGGRSVELKGQAQNRLILEQIKALGYDPQALPKPAAGMPGVKKAVRDKLDKKEPFEAGTAFDESWKRLRGYGDIKDS